MFFKSIRISLRAALLAGTDLFLVAAFTLSAPAQTQSSPASGRSAIDEVLKGLNRSHSLGQVAISPDGKMLAWTERTKGGTEIHLAPLGDLFKGGPVEGERVTAATHPEQYCHEGQIAWSPDAKSLIFISDCAKPNQPDLYLLFLDGSPARRLTELKGYVEAPAFSPDGTRVAFLYVEGATRPAGALAAMKPLTGVIGEGSAEIERVAIVRVNASKPEITEWATPADLHVYEFDWRPDGHGLTYIAADPPGENNWWVAKLYTQDLNGVPNDRSSSLGWVNGEPRAILAPAEVPGPLHGLQIAVPRWSPDGKEIAFIGGLMSDQGVTGGDVWIIPAAGGQPVDLTPGRPSSPAWIEWDGNLGLYVSELDGSDSFLTNFLLQSGPDGLNLSLNSHSTVFHLPASIGDGRQEMSLSFTSDHSLAVFRVSSFDTAPEIYIAEAIQPANIHSADRAPYGQLSHFNEGVKPAWGKTESLLWKSDQFIVQGWLMLPKDYDPAKKYPMIVEVHGGPAAAAKPHWGSGALSAEVFSALGYFVLMPNPRGSFGQGEEFTQANRKDFGYGDLRDILAGVDAVEAEYPVDPGRVGITGWSYGGFMTMFAVTQTQRFKAAVAGAGISNWQSYYGENSIDQWMMPYFGASVYDDPKVYAKSSAINFIRKVTTPTLVVVGERDGECPAPQSFEFWHALRDRHIPTRLVVYPNEGHGIADPVHRRDMLERAAEWFARYLPPAS
jgi:dipeptidyl aminopeptidase/acylaminoacyl peptidase